VVFGVIACLTIVATVLVVMQFFARGFPSAPTFTSTVVDTTTNIELPPDTGSAPQAGGRTNSNRPAATLSSATTSLPAGTEAGTAGQAAPTQGEPARTPADASASGLLGPAVARAREALAASSISPAVLLEAEEAFARARQLFDQQDYTAAADAFGAVVKILEREDPAFELRWTANEFAAVSRTLASQAAAQVERIYVSTDEGVSEPVALAPNLPVPAEPGTPRERLAVLELVIDPRGVVESAHFIGHAQHYRDRWWISAAKSWLFKPATKNGQPVKFLKRIVFVDGEWTGPS
jgi:hypothetical protein